MRRFTYWQIAVFVGIVLAITAPSWHYRHYVHYLTYDGDNRKAPLTNDCSAHGFEPYNGTRKVFDLLLMYNEVDFLEIRLHTLKDVVDWFVIVEADTTFTGLPKPLFLEENWDRFKDFHHKIIHKVIEDKIDSAWSHEWFLRNQLLDAAKEGDPQQGDMIIVSDLDEIPRPEIITMLKGCVYPTRTTLYTRFFAYSYQWRHWRQWDHPQVTEYRGEDTMEPESLRAIPGEVDSTDIMDAGWHCSSCFKTIKQVEDKLEGFSHADSFNTPENRDPRTIIDRYRHGLDLYGRVEEKYQPYPIDDIPPYVKQNAERFKYLTDRTGPTAEFIDVADYVDGPY